MTALDAIDRYLNEVCWAMGGSLPQQQAARDELRAHIAEAAREFELQGHARDDAIARALGALGDPGDVGRAMRGSRGTAPLRRPLVQPAGALILERRTAYHVPSLRVALMVAAAAALPAAIALVYLWPD